MLLKKMIGGYNMPRVTKPVFIVGTGQTFPSASAAAKALGINPGNLYSVLAGRRKTAGGYKFGYASNRAVSVSKNGETKIYSSIEAAAKAVHANPNKIDSIVSGRVKKTVKGYEFSYVDASKVSSSAPPSEKITSKKRRTKSKKVRKSREQSRQNPTQKQIDYAEAQRKAQRERAEYKRNKRQADKITSSMDELTNLLQRVNEQLELYYDNKMMGYSRAAQDVAEFQNYLGTTEDGLFDLSDENIRYLSETYTPEDVYQWKKQIEDEINSKEGKFWDLKGQMEEREHYALQFNIPIGQLDDIADLLPDLWDVLELANTKQKKGSKVDGTWDTIKDAVQGTITRDAMTSLIDNLRQFWSGNRTRQLDEILADLNQYKANPSPLMMDDDELPF